jgi:hypothetical protein
MAKPKTTPKQYAASIALARKSGGNEHQSHWQARLKAVMKQRAKPVKTPATR